MYSVKQAAEILDITPRAIQLKCKKFKVAKIENEFQINQELIDLWKQSKETKRNEIQVTSKISQRSSQTTSQKTIYLLIAISVAIVLFIAIVFYFNLTSQIDNSKQELREEKKAHYNEVKALNKRLIDANDVIHSQDLEIQALKYKDTLRRIFRN